MFDFFALMENYFNRLSSNKNYKKKTSRRQRKRKAYTLAKRTIRKKFRIKHFGQFSPIKRFN